MVQDIEGLVTNILKDIAWPTLAGIVIVMFMYAGIMFATAEGEPEKIRKARAAVIWAVVGMILGILAYSIPTIINSVF